ncbi:MAG: sigma-70 family RNA polymerase sigma factor [Verrucomicrobiota bacterium]
MHPENSHSPVDLNSQFLRQWMKHEQPLRALVRSCIPKTAEVDEIMQSVSVVAWQKYGALNAPESFFAWVSMIARYEILIARRKFARDRLILDEDIVTKLTEEGGEEFSVRHLQLEALDGCVAKLPEERRRLAIAAYSPGVSMKSLAAQLGRTEGSLYQLVARIRQDLFQCVEKTLKEAVL